MAGKTLRSSPSISAEAATDNDRPFLLRSSRSRPQQSTLVFACPEPRQQIVRINHHAERILRKCIGSKIFMRLLPRREIIDLQLDLVSVGILVV